MFSLFTLIVFLFLLVLLYTAVAGILSARAWYLKWRCRRQDADGEAAALRIDGETDRLKELAFTATVILVFFGLTPAAVFLWLF